MPYFTEQARSYSECLEKIRAKYGQDAKVLIEKTVRKGGFLGLLSREEIEMTGTYGNAPPVDLETAKRQVLAAAGKTIQDASMQAVLREITSLGESVRGLNEKVDASISGFSPASRHIQAGNDKNIHPTLQKLEEDLLYNEFTPSFIKPILERVRGEFRLDELDNYEEVQKRVIMWIGEKISIYNEPEITGKKKSRIIVLLGPTGVGKTTTLVKLAALYGEMEMTDEAVIWHKQIRLITMDYYRIGAEYQIKRFGEFMDVPVNSGDSHDDLKKLLALYRQDVDFVLIDTTGKSPKNYEELGQMKAMLDACPARTEMHLCIQASSKSSDLREILKQFEPFKYKSVIITKMDETQRIGNVISILAEEQKNISFITTGQNIPWDLERATVIRFLMNLEEFTVDRRALADHFSQTELDKTVK